MCFIPNRRQDVDESSSRSLLYSIPQKYLQLRPFLYGLIIDMAFCFLVACDRHGQKLRMHLSGVVVRVRFPPCFLVKELRRITIREVRFFMTPRACECTIQQQTNEHTKLVLPLAFTQPPHRRLCIARRESQTTSFASSFESSRIEHKQKTN